MHCCYCTAPPSLARQVCHCRRHRRRSPLDNWCHQKRSWRTCWSLKPAWQRRRLSRSSTIGGVATLVLTTNKCARIVSDGTNYQVVTYGGGGGGGTPGGSPSNVQFNSAGSFGGDAGFTYTTLGQVGIAGGTI